MATKNKKLPGNPLPCGCVAMGVPEIVGFEEMWQVYRQAHVVHCPLHAAASDLLDACKEAEGWLDNLPKSLRGDVVESLERIRAAIAKSEEKENRPVPRKAKNPPSVIRRTDVAQQILTQASLLVLILRDADKDSLEQARARLQEFNDAWTKSGEGDVLPCSGKNADVPGCLNDVDVTEQVIAAIDMRIEQASIR